MLVNSTFRLQTRTVFDSLTACVLRRSYGRERSTLGWRVAMPSDGCHLGRTLELADRVEVVRVDRVVVLNFSIIHASCTVLSPHLVRLIWFLKWKATHLQLQDGRRKPDKFIFLD